MPWLCLHQRFRQCRQQKFQLNSSHFNIELFYFYFVVGYSWQTLKFIVLFSSLMSGTIQKIEISHLIEADELPSATKKIICVLVHVKVFSIVRLDIFLNIIRAYFARLRFMWLMNEGVEHPFLSVLFLIAVVLWQDRSWIWYPIDILHFLFYFKK